MNKGLTAPANDTQSTIQIGFRSIVINTTNDQTNGSEHVNEK